jgi:CDP-diacylglycerol--glycerol-3-phosphate 3-phosphatidyltransferase
MNLPNGLTVARIAATPLIATLPFASAWGLRLAAFLLFTAAGITDYVDGHIARSRKQETDLGRMLDPLADKLLLLGTFVPMYLLARTLPFETPFGSVGLAWWVIAIVLGRELFMTLFRYAAQRRGVVISAIGPAKWKTGFQLVWQGAAYFWFFAATLAMAAGWTTSATWHAFALFNGSVATLAMIGAVVLTVYSFLLYVRSFGSLFVGALGKAAPGRQQIP